MEALKIVKQFKKARFKQFKSEKEALDFALNGDDNSLREPPMYSCVSLNQKQFLQQNLLKKIFQE